MTNHFASSTLTPLPSTTWPCNKTNPLSSASSRWWVIVVCGWLNSPLNLYSAKCVNSTVTVFSAGNVHWRKWISTPCPSFGSGRIKCGCFFAVASIVRYTSRGITAHSDWASLTCRIRHIASNSFWGRALVFSRSMYEERVLIPGVEDGTVSAGIRGAGGGGGNNEDDTGGWGGVWDALGMGIGIEAFFLKCWILSL